MFILAVFFLGVLPFQWAIPFFREDIPLVRLLGIILLFWWIGYVCVKPRSLVLPRHIILPLIGFLGWVVVSLGLQGQLSGDWLHKGVFLVGLYPLSLVWMLLFDQGYTRKLVQTLIWGGVLSAGVALGIFLLQFWLGLERILAVLNGSIFPVFLGQDLAQMVAKFPSLLVNIGGETWLRATGLFPDPHVASYFYGMVGFLAAGLFVENQERRWLYAVGALFLADLLTFSRGGYLGLVAGGMFLMYFVLKQRGIGIKGAAWFGGIPIILWLLWPAVRRFFSSFLLQDASSTDRFELWRVALETIAAHPWIGLGLGQYAEYAAPFQSVGLPYYAHNLYLDIAVECGIIGLLFFVWYVGGALVAAFRKTGWNAQAAGITSGLLMYGVHSLFETALFSLHVAVLLSFFVALAWDSRTQMNTRPLE